RRAAAHLPGFAVLRPGFRAGLTWRRNGVPPPQFLPRVGIPSVEKTSGGELAAGHPGDDDTAGDARSAGSGVALVEIGKGLVPHLLAGLQVERDEMVVDRDAEQLAVV